MYKFDESECACNSELTMLLPARSLNLGGSLKTKVVVITMDSPNVLDSKKCPHLYPPPYSPFSPSICLSVRLSVSQSLPNPQRPNTQGV